ncbi:MAG: NADH-quinone oxidoreductase subunit C [Chitinophagaceae bacterium]
MLVELVPLAVFEEGSEWPTIMIEPASWKSLALLLTTTPALQFDFLFCLTCVDWKTHLGMVFHITSTLHRHTVVVKAKLNRDHPEIDTVSDIWKTAEFHEREVYDLFGVKFLKHPDLRRLFLTDDYVGWPLRKDFEDAVNMIKL